MRKFTEEGTQTHTYEHIVSIAAQGNNGINGMKLHQKRK